MKRVLIQRVRVAVSVAIACVSLAHAQTVQCPFETDGATLTQEGLVLTRYALGLRGAPLVANTSFAAIDAPAIESTIACPGCGLDINGNGSFDTTDAQIINRKLAGYSDNALTNGLNLGTGTRNTPDAIKSFLLAGCNAGGGGTVTSITSGTGLAGGIITTAGTLSIIPSYQLPQACAANQIPKWSGTAWICGTDNTGTTGGSGTVTSVGTGAGLAGGPITTSGTINLAATQLLPTTACAANQIPKWNGTAWTCGNDATVANAWTQGGNAFGAAGIIGTTDAQPLKVQSAGAQVSVVVPGDNGLRIVQTTGPFGNAPNVINGSVSNFAGAMAATVAGGGYTASNCYEPSTGTETRNCRNAATSLFATVGGGVSNIASGAGSTIGGGDTNTATSNSNTVSGGSLNTATGAISTIGGGSQNTVSGEFGVVSGGSLNTASGLNAVVAGGTSNVASNNFSTVSGGNGNTASGINAVVAGGNANVASNNFSTVSGGSGNTALGINAVVAGGNGNVASNNFSTVSGGTNNAARAIYSVVPGGFQNVAGGAGSFAAGVGARVRDAVQTGEATTCLPDTCGDEGTFVWSDFSSITGFESSGPNQFLVRADGGVGINTNVPRGTMHVRRGSGSGIISPQSPTLLLESDGSNLLHMFSTDGAGASSGIRFGSPANHTNGGIFSFVGSQNMTFRTNNTTRLTIQGSDGFVALLRGSAAHPLHVGADATTGNGAHLTAGGTWTNGSSREFKEHFAALNPKEILAKLAHLPVLRWNYKGTNERHIGPMAEDFYRAFNVGGDPKYISTVDASGVALAAVQGLNETLKEEVAKLQREAASLRQEASAMAKVNEAMHRELIAIKQKLGL